MFELGTRGAVGRVPRWGAVVLVAVLFPLVPAPSVERFADAGFLGCSYATTFGFFEVARENLGLAAVAALVLLVTSPIALFWMLLRLMAEWDVPMRVQVEVLRRERGFAVRNMPFAALSATAWGVVFTLMLWLSAVVAVGLDSPAAGILVLPIPALIAVAIVRRFVPALRPRVTDPSSEF